MNLMKSHVLHLLIASHLLVAVAVQAETLYTEVVGVVKVSLKEGVNYIAPPLRQSNNRVLAHFGEKLPSGSTEGSSTILEAWDASSQTLGERYWHSNAPGFEGWNTNGFTNADQAEITRARGFRVTLREGVGSRDFLFSGALPTNTVTQIVNSNGYTLVQSGFPLPIAMEDSQLVESGFTGGGNLRQSDWVLFFNPITQLFDILAWYDSSASVWRDAAFNASNRELNPGEAFIIWRKNRPTDLVWTLPPPYPVQ